MRLGQIRWNNEVTAAIFEGNLARPIPDHTLYDLIRRSEIDHVPLAELAREQASAHREPAPPAMPIHPREVWACGGNYGVAAASRDGETGAREDLFGYVARQPRPELTSKGTSRNCVGPGKAIGIRSDSSYTVPEAELAILLGSRGVILGYTLANDVTAWDLVRENPLYVTQAKIFAGSCALGPYFVTPDELADPANLEISCAIRRGEETIFSGSVSTARMSRPVAKVVEFLLRSNPVPSGSVLLTGTGIVVGAGSALAAGDLVTIRAEGIGELSNPVAQV